MAQQFKLKLQPSLLEQNEQQSQDYVDSPTQKQPISNKADQLIIQFPNQDFKQDFEKGISIRYHKPLIRQCLRDIKSKVRDLDVRSSRKNYVQELRENARSRLQSSDYEYDETLAMCVSKTMINPDSKILQLKQSIDGRLRTDHNTNNSKSQRSQNKSRLQDEQNLIKLPEINQDSSRNRGQEFLQQYSYQSILKNHSFTQMKDFLSQRRNMRQGDIEKRAQAQKDKWQYKSQQSQNSMIYNSQRDNYKNSVISGNTDQNVYESSKSPLRMKIEESFNNIKMARGSGIEFEILKSLGRNKQNLSLNNSLDLGYKNVQSISQINNLNGMNRLLNRSTQDKSLAQIQSQQQQMNRIMPNLKNISIFGNTKKNISPTNQQAMHYQVPSQNSNNILINNESSFFLTNPLNNEDNNIQKESPLIKNINTSQKLSDLSNKNLQKNNYKPYQDSSLQKQPSNLNPINKISPLKFRNPSYYDAFDKVLNNSLQNYPTLQTQISVLKPQQPMIQINLRKSLLRQMSPNRSRIQQDSQKHQQLIAFNSQDSSNLNILDRISLNLKQTSRARDELNQSISRIRDEINQTITRNNLQLKVNTNKSILMEESSSITGSPTSSPKLRQSLNQQFRSSVMKARLLGGLSLKLQPKLQQNLIKNIYQNSEEDYSDYDT